MYFTYIHSFIHIFVHLFVYALIMFTHYLESTVFIYIYIHLFRKKITFIKKKTCNINDSLKDQPFNMLPCFQDVFVQVSLPSLSSVALKGTTNSAPNR